MRNVKLILAYDGADFSGWQVQPARRTIQGELAAAIARVTGEHVLPQGAGRTDAGVHALAQVASVAIATRIPSANLVIALNHVLPRAIRVMQAEEAPAEFHARHSALAKTYEYRILRAPICPPFRARYVYHHPWPLDEGAIAAAAASVLGEHDFTSFAAVDPERNAEARVSGGKSNHRLIWRSEFALRGDELVYTVRGNSFLHHMVRNLVGTFLLIGKRTLAPSDVLRILAARERSANPGATAPAGGLYLVNVEY